MPLDLGGESYSEVVDAEIQISADAMNRLACLLTRIEGNTNIIEPVRSTRTESNAENTVVEFFKLSASPASGDRIVTMR